MGALDIPHAEKELSGGTLRAVYMGRVRSLSLWLLLIELVRSCRDDPPLVAADTHVLNTCLVHP